MAGSAGHSLESKLKSYGKNKVKQSKVELTNSGAANEL